ncbi:MAG: CaiB/BaiF CoA transferase family protein [Hyphomicrobiales bacterium]
MAERALEGLRVIEFCDEIGSYCGRLLADLGAEVIKVEPPGGGIERHTQPYYKAAEPGPDTAIGFWVHNTSKKSVVLDLETAEGQRLARALALSADAVIEDNTPGWMAARGLGYEELRREKPALVYTSITGFGQDGPHSGYAYTDIVGQAMGGVLTLAGEPADPPNMIVGNQANLSASIQAAQGTLMAVLHAEATGQGQHVDVSAQEAISMSQETAMQTWDLQKRNRVRTGERGAIPVALPGIGVYPCKDGYVMLFILAPAGEDFPALVDWMRERGMHEDLDEEPYAPLCNTINMAVITQMMMDPAKAAENVQVLQHINDVVHRFFASLSAREAYEEGQHRRLLIGIVSTPKDLAENTQLRARDWFAKFELEFLNATVEFPGAPYRLSETPVVIRRPPRLGEHTDEVLAELDA